MVRWAVVTAIHVIDLHGLLAQQADSGQLWWDNVHLSDYGQELAAEYMTSGSLCYFEILTLVRELTVKRARQS